MVQNPSTFFEYLYVSYLRYFNKVEDKEGLIKKEEAKANTDMNLFSPKPQRHPGRSYYFLSYFFFNYYLTALP
jgi:hypothetical protein